VRRTTIADIATRMGLSTTTITRALHGKPKVSGSVRKEIIAVAETMGYTTNRMAQALARKPIVIGMVYPKEPHEFFGYVEAGLQSCIHDLIDYNVRGIFRPVQDLHSSEETRVALQELAAAHVDGVVLSAGFDQERYLSRLVEMNREGMPILSLIDVMGEQHGFGSVQLNGSAAGRMAAQFLGFCLKRDSRSAVVITSAKDMAVHRDCIGGFLSEAGRSALEVKGVYEARDDKRIAYFLTDKVTNDFPNLGGIYVSSYNSVAVCDFLEEHGLEEKISVIGQDLYPELVERLRRNSLKATLFQDPFEQASTAVKQLYLQITERKAPKMTLMTPQLVLRSNLECYMDRY
jgi:LacI family transcriptional regulator